MAEEKDLIKKRGSFKGRLTAFSTYLNSVNVSSLTQPEANELQLRVGKMESLYDQYDEVQLRLECIVDNMDTQVSDRVEFESQYYKLIAKAQEILTNFNKIRDNFESASERCSRSSNRKLVKLPTIQLPKFSGSYDNWLEFRDTFLSLIHSNDDIEDVNKFHYLRASLEGSAAVLLQSVEFSANNYEVVWKLICDRFDNKRLLLQNHVSALFNIEPIVKESSISLKRVIDQVNKNLRALESLGEPVKSWDTLLIHILTQKLDAKSYREWEELKGRLDKDKSITFETFITFVRNRADLIETLELSRSTTVGQSSLSTKTNAKLKSMMSVQDSNSNKQQCPKCDGDHNLASCSQFLALSNTGRLQILSNYKVCFNCFRKGHYANHCKKPGCKLCKRKHNTLIHVSDINPKSLAKGQSVCSNSETPSLTGAEISASSRDPHVGGPVTLSASVTASAKAGNEVLLSTALIKLFSSDNREHIARAVLDSGSTSCLMTEQMWKQLNLPTVRVDKSVLGINNALSRVGKMSKVAMKSLDDNFSTNIHCLILPSITDKVPSRQIDLSSLNIPSDVCLADPYFHTPANVDLIIGADLFWNLLGLQKIKLGPGKPILYETHLGWLVSGPINSSLSSNIIKCNFTTVPNNSDEFCSDVIQDQLTRFWQLEEVVPKLSYYSSEEKLCEEHFVKNTTRLPDGRFCVKIPLRQSPDILGESKQRAQHCFLSLERRIQNRSSFKKMYTEFMSEYKSLNHMSLKEHNDSRLKSYYIPHHGVLREDSSTTKLRVVFNASSPTTTGVSLNHIQLVGPTVQDDLLSILIRFRQHKYVLAADVEKMYRQIMVHPDDRYLQQIIWRDDPHQPLQTYRLNTVTYGTASAPFLATRCLKQIGLECSNEKICEIITHDFYVDDLLTGADNISDVLWIQEQVTAALSSACMNLRKWKSNLPQLMSQLNQSLLDLNIGNNEPCKTLGLGWQINSDKLCFPISSSVSAKNTKRDMLSAIAQIFDPLGLLTPCVILMKILLQRLWLYKLSWDEPLSPEISSSWQEIVSDLPLLNHIRIPRLVLCDSFKSIELHIFTDASERAYGACVYVRTVNEKGEIFVSLLLAKSRVAPIKVTTIPRLELCGALVGSRLYEKVVNSLRLHIRSTTFWTDSTIVLGWLKMLPNKLQPFVRNRVAEIIEKTGNSLWRHVPTSENPADYISRGVAVKSLESLEMWWSGPKYLKKDMSNWPSSPVTAHTLPETRPKVSLHVNINDHYEELIDFNRFSKFLRLKRCVAYVLRFISACKKQPITSTYLNDDELKKALSLIVRISQNVSFPEYQLLLRQHPLPKKSPLLKLNVFLDEDKIMRVGGRLNNSDFAYETKHPIIIQSTHRFTKLLFLFEHERLMHAGPQLLLASIRETYWPVGGRSLAKACYHSCIRCNRMKGQIVTPLMGNLPRSRLASSYPFENVGVDYAGPMTAASRQGRGCRHIKVYVVIFVCFATKAIHLELVGDLTSNNYLLALRRFISRRGKPKNIYSDNGTSFVGAYNDLAKFLKSNCNSLADNIANEEIKFHFIPAYSPHFGGLWEAGVKSTKFHLLRVLGNCNLTYEEFNTVLVQVESILNSRPLTPLSSDPEDLMPLTPGHFLIGRPLTSLPVQDCRDFSTNHLTRFHRIEQLRQHFWARWSKEYISELQQRSKWRSNNASLRLDTLVVLKEDNLPPLKWRLGRIVAVYPGADGIARVADVKTASGIVRRSFSKICPLLAFDSPVGVEKCSFQRPGAC